MRNNNARKIKKYFFHGVWYLNKSKITPKIKNMVQLSGINFSNGILIQKKIVYELIFLKI
tara:strand:+ start:89879 stop:90058 length:180 start_codon:yes stop_codon:yes gene_type:complete